MNKPFQSVLLAAVASLVTLSGCEDASNQDANQAPPPPATTQNDLSTPRPAASGTLNPPPAPDNTRNNRGDGSQDNMTPPDQSESSEHIRMTADIRRAVIADDTLSTTAKNCKIITDKTGTVTLRGVVASQAEKDAIEAHARLVAGQTSVVNQLEIDTN